MIPMRRKWSVHDNPGQTQEFRIWYYRQGSTENGGKGEGVCKVCELEYPEPI